MSPKKHNRVSVHPLQYVLVAISAFVIVALEQKVPLFASGLRVAPFVLVTTIAALFGDYIAGILAIVLCTLAVEYVVPPAGFVWDASTIFKLAEFLVIGTIIFVIAWRSRTLHQSNVALKELTESLQDITASLHADARGNEKQLEKLSDVNKRLISLVNQFIEDDDYWARKITTPVTLPEKQLRSPHLRRVKDGSSR